MWCVVSNCNNGSSPTFQEVTYHPFPTEPLLRAAWLATLHMVDWKPDDHSMVCSKHFHEEDWLVTSSGLRTLREDAVPAVDVQVCRICFATNCKLYSINADRTLSKAYQSLTGLLVENDDEIPPYLCSECASRLQNCVSFRDTSLRAHVMMMEIVRYNGRVTLESIKSVKRQSSLGSNQRDCNMDITLSERNNMYIDEQADIECSAKLCEHVTVDSIKIESNDLINQNNENTEVIINKDMGSMLDLSKDAHDDLIKVECVMNQDSHNVHSTTAIEDSDVFVDDRPSVAETSQNTKLSTTALQLAVEIPIDTRQVTVNTHQSPGLVGNILPSDISACGVYTRSTDSHNRNMYSDKTFDKSKHRKRFEVLSDIKPYSCNKCNAAFTQIEDLTKHLKTHVGVKLYTCGVCSRTFRFKSYLIRHLVEHSGEKLYSCDTCKKAFNDKRHLKKHTKSHTGL